MKRRTFVKAAACLAIPYFVPRHVFAAAGRPAASDRIRAGVIGTGGRIAYVISEAPKDIQVVALADCDLRQMGTASTFGGLIGKLYSDDYSSWPRYQDYREMLEREKLDAVFVGTTTHARALCCIHAVQANVDVYAEKPLTLTIEEGQVLVRAARKHERVVQIGTQCRSLEWYRWSNDLIRRGALGKIHKVQAHNFAPPVRRAAKEGRPVPAELNWDMWCNQAELVPYDDESYHPSCERWGKWWDFDGGGLTWGMTGWGTHSLDMIQASLGTDYTGPVEITLEKAGDPQSPVAMRYADGTLLELSLPQGYGDFWGARYFGEKGTLERTQKVQSDPPELVAEHPAYIGYPATPHLQNWIDCMRSRERPHADVEIAHRSHSLCHLANIARQLGRGLKWNPETEAFVGDDEANALRRRPRRKGYELPEVV
jgi:predicted dehydrogenase